MIGIAGGMFLLAGMTGAVAALGDTIFPVKSLAEGLARDFSPAAHVLERLRVFHPFVALGAAVAVLYTVHFIANAAASDNARSALAQLDRLALVVRLCVYGQICLGFINLALLAPTWMQLAHLALANVLWIAFTLLVATALASSGATEPLDASVEPGAIDDEIAAEPAA